MVAFTEIAFPFHLGFSEERQAEFIRMIPPSDGLDVKFATWPLLRDLERGDYKGLMTAESIEKSWLSEWMSLAFKELKSLGSELFEPYLAPEPKLWRSLTEAKT